MPDEVASTGSKAGSLAGLVLAGGESRRMGRDKATLAIPGGSTTLVEHVVDVVAQRCSPVYVMAAPGNRCPRCRFLSCVMNCGGKGRCGPPDVDCAPRHRPGRG